MRGILTLMMLIAAYIFASIGENIEKSSIIEQYASGNIFEGTVIDISDDGSSTYNVIHLRSGDLEWAIKYFDHYKNKDSGLKSLRELAEEQANLRVVLDCKNNNKRNGIDLNAVHQGRIVRNIHIHHNDNKTCQIKYSTLL